MENYQGDLADILRATATAAATTIDGSNAAAEVGAATDSWLFPSNYFSDPSEDFGDPFTYMKDPLLPNFDTTPSSVFFSGGFPSNDHGNINLAHKVVDGETNKRPSNIFSRMLQISPNAKLTVSPSDSQAAAAEAAELGLKGGSILGRNNRTLISPSSSKGCLVESPVLQISPPRNTGIKRRKSQAKRVVCIPAPAPANSRASGEVVPSDLWAWRKYGQKPIKGSPYPRGYYRCSSSKGCSARKQVERSRTDPNMLVITYTSEHNHPWPTQRNALAGSTRSQPSKCNTSTKNSEAQKPKQTDEHTVDAKSRGVKEEADQEFDNQFEMDDAEFEEGFPQTYKPRLANSEDSFFADLGEIEADTDLDLLFTQGFSRDDQAQENNDLDPFTFYDWPSSNSSSTLAAGTTATTTTESHTV